MIKSRTRVPNCCRLRSRILGGVKNSFDIRRTGEHRLKVNKVRHKEIKMYTYCIKPLVISQECKLLPLIKNYHSGQYLFVHVMIYSFDYLLCKSSSLRVENSIPLFAYTASQSIHNIKCLEGIFVKQEMLFPWSSKLRLFKLSTPYGTENPWSIKSIGDIEVRVHREQASITVVEEAEK